MRYYEILYIVNPNLEDNALSNTMGEIGSELEKTKSKLINHRVWGKKRLAYPIQKQKYGSYILLQFEGGEQNKMVDFDTWMKLNNAVLRHMTVSLDEKPEIYVEERKHEQLKEDGKAEGAKDASLSVASDILSPVSEDSEVEVSAGKIDEGESIEGPIEEESLEKNAEEDAKGTLEENKINEEKEGK